MYFIVNYDSWQKYEKSFSDFQSAFMIWELLGDINNKIEFIDEDVREIVYEKSFEEVYLDHGRKYICECVRRIQ